VDVVTTANQDWAHDPFGGELIDGYIWGRGTLDMKGGVVMMLCAFLRARAEGLTPAGDVVLNILADEEAGSDYGARYMVEQHPELFDGCKYAIGEGGGPSRYVGDRRYYSVAVAEKQVCWMKTRFTGPGGHASQPMRGGAMAKLGHLLTTLNANRLPVHVLPVMETMINALCEIVPAEQAEILAKLLDPAQTDAVLDAMIDQGMPEGRMLDSLLHNTVNATVVHGGFKTNVIPSEITLELDGRLLPGFTPDDMIREIHQLLGSDELTFEVIRHDAGGADADLALIPLFQSIIDQVDPGAALIPTMVGGFTDGRMYARLGIQNYGFLPALFPKEFEPWGTVHAANERIPADALDFGADVLYRVIGGFGA
jgi:acetylornithine deacetylase/succinyl-diaminopimelate desuccinylase-like protein